MGKTTHESCAPNPSSMQIIAPTQMVGQSSLPKAAFSSLLLKESEGDQDPP
jgi:hypothetical protein